MAAKQANSIAAQLAVLPTMPMKDLWALWDAHFPRRPGTWNRDYVASRVAWCASANRNRCSASAGRKCI